MQDLFISVNENKLRISTVDPKTGFKSVVEELTENVIKDYKIVDVATFTSVLGETIAKVTNQPKNRLLLNFIMEPEEVILRLFTLNKGSAADEDLVLSEIKKLLDGVTIEDLYFSHQKIAPFLYQFIGVRKDLLETYIEISNAVGVGLKSVVPWVMLLPKYTESADSTIFIAKRGSKQIIALSELGGIFFDGVYEEARTSKELKELVSQVSSFYKRDGTVQSIFTLNYDSASFSDFKVNRITLPVAELDSESTDGFELNILTNFMIDKDPMILSGQANIVNLLPVPVVEKKTSALVYVGSIVVGLGLVGSLVFFAILKRPSSSSAGNLAQNINQNQNVLSEANSAPESSQSGDAEKKPVLNRADLKVMVQNSTNVAGLASKTSKFLQELGYKDIEIGNAELERKDTLLRFKKDKISYKDTVIQDVKDKFPDTVVEDTLDSKADYDLLIIVGGTPNL